MKAADLIGQRFGRLLVVSRVSNTKRGNTRFNCICDCGAERNVSSGNLRNGTTQSCGCLAKDLLRARRTKHGMTKTPEHRAWTAMRNRCANPDKTYSAWNGRGIKVCERWNVFENFLADVGPRPSRGHSIDRIDVNGDYEPSNVRWATRIEQARNTTRTLFVSVRGKSIPIADAAQASGLKLETVRKRIKSYGFSHDDALSTPPLRNQFDGSHPSKKQRVVRRSV